MGVEPVLSYTEILPSPYLSLRDGGDELDDTVGDGLLELEAALLPQERRQEAHQHAVLERVLEAQLHRQTGRKKKKEEEKNGYTT